jgi:hypothetical protein
VVKNYRHKYHHINGIQEKKERISVVEDTVKEIITTVNENSKHKNTPKRKHAGN